MQEASGQTQGPSDSYQQSVRPEASYYYKFPGCLFLALHQTFFFGLMIHKFPGTIVELANGHVVCPGLMQLRRLLDESPFNQLNSVYDVIHPVSTTEL